MPKRLRLVAYSVLLVLALYMYYVSGQRPEQPVTEGPAGGSASGVTATVIDPFPRYGSLDVRRDALTQRFENAPFNLTFDFVPLEDGRSRVIGRSEDGRTTLELIGRPEAVTSANFMAALPSNNPLVRLRNLNAISALVETTLMDWPDASAWVSQNIDLAFSGSGVSRRAGEKMVTMKRTPRTETLVVTITGPKL